MKKLYFYFIVVTALILIGVSVTSAQAPDGSGWWSGFTIQNADSSEITVVSTAYHLTGGSDSQYVANVNIPDGLAVTFHPGLAGTCGATATAGCRIAFSPDLPAGFSGSVVVSSDGPAVASAQINNNQSGSVGSADGSARAGYQGTGGQIAANILYFPSVKNNFAGQTTAFFVQAAGSDANTTITYRMNNGDVETETVNIEANKSYLFLPSAAGVDSCNGGTGGGSAVAPCFGGASVESSTGPIAGTMVEYVEGASVANFVLSTRGITPSDIGSRIIAPTMKNNFFSANTGAAILNTHSSSTATVVIDFTVTNVAGSCSANIGDTEQVTLSLDPGQSKVVSYSAGTVGDLPNCVFYSMVASTEANGNEPLAVVVNESKTKSTGKVKAVYSGFNSANASETVFFPLVKEDFNKNTTGLVIVNAGTVATQVDVTYAGTTGTHVLRTISLEPGQGVPLRQAFKGSTNFSAVSGGLPSASNKYSVSASSVTSGVPIVGLAQEAGVNGGNLDIYNVEGFNQ